MCHIFAISYCQKKAIFHQNIVSWKNQWLKKFKKLPSQPAVRSFTLKPWSVIVRAGSRTANHAPSESFGCVHLSNEKNK